MLRGAGYLRFAPVERATFPERDLWSGGVVFLVWLGPVVPGRCATFTTGLRVLRAFGSPRGKACAWACGECSLSIRGGIWRRLGGRETFGCSQEWQQYSHDFRPVGVRDRPTLPSRMVGKFGGGSFSRGGAGGAKPSQPTYAGSLWGFGGSAQVVRMGPMGPIGPMGPMGEGDLVMLGGRARD